MLIGSVGSGKSTFSTYLKEVALDPKVNEKLLWIRLDLNNAPVNEEEIYTWVKKSIIIKIRESYNEVDFDSLETIKDIFSEELEKFDKMAKTLLPESVYNEELFKKISSLTADLDLTLNSLTENFLVKEGKNLIIVLDNCDKRNLKEQLLMFEVANWIKESVKAIVFLPLRDTTYDHHKKEKPLDTVIKDLTFRITPPSLDKVIYQRFKYANRLSENGENSGYYSLPNGMSVSYPKSEEIYYLRSILKSLFQNPFFKKMISGLAGSDIRYGIELFLDFCKSGHISESEIFKINQNKGNYDLPFYIVNRIFLRGDRIYYKDEASRIKNLFYSDPKDSLPNPFIRILILKWLQKRQKEKGDSGVVGFHSIKNLLNDLVSIGCEINRLNSELLTLLRQKLIISESQDLNEFQENDYISINISGLVHLEMLYNLDYLSACSEDTWFDNIEDANKVLINMSGKGSSSHLSLGSTLENSEILKNYLLKYYQNYFSVHDNILEENKWLIPVDFERMSEIIDNSKYKEKIIEYIQFEKGAIKKAIINNITNYGVFVSFEDSDKVGFLKKELIGNNDFELEVDDEIMVQILCFNDEHKKYEVGLTSEEIKTTPQK